MEEFLNDMISNVWPMEFSGMCEGPVSYGMIEESVDRMCDFFNIDKSYSVIEGESTAVNLGDRETYGDEILFYNYEQLGEMGITGQDGLDLVMTHEGTHIMLQDMDTGFSPYQEELCCDYMAGVRAGLNGMDVSELENAFAGLGHDATHPDGSYRIDAIEDGLAFAKDYMATHELPPTFNECLENFKGEHMQDIAELAQLRNEVIAQEHTMAHYQRLVEMEPTNEVVLRQYHESELNHEKALYDYESKQRLVDEKDEALMANEPSFRGKEKELTSFSKSNVDYHMKKADECFAKEESCYKRAADAEHRGDAKLAKEYLYQAKKWHEAAEGHLDSAKAWGGKKVL